MIHKKIKACFFYTQKRWQYLSSMKCTQCTQCTLTVIQFIYIVFLSNLPEGATYVIYDMAMAEININLDSLWWILTLCSSSVRLSSEIRTIATYFCVFSIYSHLLKSIKLCYYISELYFPMHIRWRPGLGLRIFMSYREMNIMVYIDIHTKV